MKLSRNDWVDLDQESTAGRNADRECTAEVSRGPHKGRQKRPRQVGQAGSIADGSTGVNSRWINWLGGTFPDVCSFYNFKITEQW